MCTDPDMLLISIAEIQDTQNPMKKIILKHHTFRKKNFEVPDKVL